jgi:hypothetical protein
MRRKSWYSSGVRLMIVLVALGLAAPARAQEVAPLFDGLDPGATPIETYRLNALGIVSHELSSASLFGSTSKWWRPVRGKFRYATRYDDFFRKLGRADLAEQHEQRRLLSGVLHWGGAAVFVGGGVLLFTGVSDGGFPTRSKVGVGLLAAGALGYIVGGAIQPPLVSEEEAVAMANEYNRRLRLHLGLAVSDHALGLTLRGPW